MSSTRRGAPTAAVLSLAAAVVLGLGHVVPALRALSPVVWGVALVLILVALGVAVRAGARARR